MWSDLWLQAIAIVMPAIANQVRSREQVVQHVSNRPTQHNFPNYSSNIRMATFALYCGLIVGVRVGFVHGVDGLYVHPKATFWGMTCDVIGRRTAWNATLFISGIFGIACVRYSCSLIIFFIFYASRQVPALPRTL